MPELFLSLPNAWQATVASQLFKTIKIKQQNILLNL